MVTHDLYVCKELIVAAVQLLVPPSSVRTLSPELPPILMIIALYALIQREICELMIGRESERLGRLGYTLAVEPDMVETLVREGFHRRLGARPLRNVVDRFLQELAMRPLLT
jgi:ATP-dependent Clp protease ATP-binding subunit ClpA